MLWKLVLVSVLTLGTLDHVVAFNYQDLDAEALCITNTTGFNKTDVEAAISKYRTCITALIDGETIKREIEEATSTKDFGGVFKKYCAKAPQVKSCITDVITGVSSCLPPDMARDAKKVYSSLIDYVCYNEGSRLTTFFKEDGPKCIKEKESAFRDCDNAIYATNATDATRASSSLFDVERCTLGGQFMTCAVTALKTCSNPNPSKLAEELRYVYLSSINCPGIKQEAPTGTTTQ